MVSVLQEVETVVLLNFYSITPSIQLKSILINFEFDTRAQDPTIDE